MEQYHKIQTVYNRDPETNFKTLLMGEFSLPEFEYLQYNNWIFTEKVDGTNIRVQYDGDGVYFRGKSDNSQISAFLVQKLIELFPKEKMKKVFTNDGITMTNVCLYGEGYGAKIQKGGGNYYKDDQDFVLFDVKIDDWWLKRKDVEDIARNLEINVIPIIGSGTLNTMVDMVTNGFYSQWGNFIAEGVVARPAVELKGRNDKRIITKIKYKDFSRIGK